MNKTLKNSLFIIGLLSSSSVFSATNSTNFQSKMIVNAACTVSVQNLDFGTVGLLTSNIDATGTVFVTCTNTTYFSVQMDKGLYGATTATRKMKSSGVDLISYSIFYDWNRTLTWGNGPSDTLNAFGNGGVFPLPFYARVPAQPSVAPGTYTDTISITVIY